MTMSPRSALRGLCLCNLQRKCCTQGSSSRMLSLGHSIGPRSPLGISLGGSTNVPCVCCYASLPPTVHYAHDRGWTVLVPRRRQPQGAPRKQLFYGWWMVWLGGFLSSLNKTAVNKGFPVFVAPVRDGFGASNAAVAFIFSLARAQSGPTGLLAGWFIDRFGPRLAVVVGALLSGGGFLALGYTTSLWAFAVLYLLVVTTGANLGFSYALAALINNWFYRRKAFAMSAFQAVDSFVPAVLVGGVALAIAAWGWQTTAQVIGLVLLGVMLPLSCLITETPERLGLTMDGDPPDGGPAPA